MSKQSKKRRKRQQARARAVAASRARDSPLAPGRQPQRIQVATAPPPPLAEHEAGGPTSTGRRGAVSALIAALMVLVVGGLVGRHLLHSNNAKAPHVAFRQPTDLTPPQAVPAGSSYVRTVVLPSGDLAVTHWIHTSKPMSSVSVRRPTVANLSGVTAQDVRVIPGNDTRARASVVSDGRRKDVYLVGGARHVYVSYVLRGAVESAPAPPGRALARITTLDVRADQPETSTTHAVQGARVLALACSPATPDALPQPCGGTAGGTSDGEWQVRLDGASTDDRVMAQLDLSGGQAQ